MRNTFPFFKALFDMAVLEAFLDNLREGSFSKEFFQASLTNVQETLSDGLPADVIDSFVDIILQRKIRASYATQLVGCLVPVGSIGNGTLDKILLWIISHHRKQPVSLLNALLRWLVGVIEYGIVDKRNVDSYYELIWGLITNEKLEKITSHLVYLLTRPEDICRGRVQALLRLHEHNGKARHTMALLSLFKSYKPEFVPESVQIKNLQGTFKVLPQTLENHLKQAQDRIHDHDYALTRSNQKYVWSRPHVKQKLIPDAAYVHLGSDRYHDQKKKIIQTLDKKSLLNSQHNLEIPCRVLTLLLNEGGIHLLATHNRDVHVRFSYVVYYTLYRTFIEKTITAPQRECEYFLKQLADLEDYMQQGIPVVSRFLKEYICTWDGYEYREQIHRLMERITFRSFEELQVLMLDYLYVLFLTGSVEEQCQIVRTLKSLILNSANRKRKKSDQENPLTFLGFDPLDDIDVDSVIPQLADFVGKMCRNGLQVTKSHPLLLFACIDFYRAVAEVEDTRSSWSILPRACVYRCLFSPSTAMLSLTCTLLLKYYRTYSEIKRRKRRNLFKAELAILQEYSADMFNCLIRDKAVSKSYQGYIFENLPLNALCNGDETFSLTESVTMQSMVQYFGQESFEEALTAFQSIFDGLCEYLDLISEKVEE